MLNEYIGTIIAIVFVLTILCCCFKCLRLLCCDSVEPTRHNNTDVERIIQRSNNNYIVANRSDTTNARRSTFQSSQFDVPTRLPNSVFTSSSERFIGYPYSQNPYDQRNNAGYNRIDNTRESVNYPPQVTSETQFSHSQVTRTFEPLIQPNNAALNDYNRYGNTNNYRECLHNPQQFSASSSTRIPNSQLTKSVDSIVRPTSQSENVLIEELSNCIKDLRAKADAESKEILAENAHFLSGEKLILLCDNLKCDELKKGQTKVKLTSNHLDHFIICTVIDHGTYLLVLKLRQGTNFLPGQKETDKFKVTLYPNVDEINFAQDGYRNVCKDVRMLKKLWAYDDDCENSTNSTICCLSKSDLHDKIKSVTNTRLHPILICAKQNSDIENFAIALKNSEPNLFQQHTVARIVTLRRPDLSTELSTYTKTIDEITNIRSYKIIFCTMGIVPKLVQHRNFSLTNDYFKEIYIVEAQKASELDCWMVIGHAANVNTKIYICGSKVKERHRSCNRYDQQSNTTADKTMFNRLRKKHSHLHNNSDFFVYKL